MVLGIGKSFIRKQEVSLAVKLLEWKYENSGYAVPGKEALKQQAEEIVDQAHAIARERGSNVLDIIKDTVSNIKQGKF